MIFAVLLSTDMTNEGGKTKLPFHQKITRHPLAARYHQFLEFLGFSALIMIKNLI